MHKFFKYLYSLKLPLLKRLVPSIVKRIFFLNKTQTIQLTFGKIRLNLLQSIDREIYLNGSYEEEQLKFLSEITTKHEV